MRPSESFIGQPIRSLQTMLRVIAEDTPGMYALIPDGIYGPETVRVIAAFQREHGLPVTGITDLETWEAVVAVYDLAEIERGRAQCLEIILDPGFVVRKGEQHPHVHLAQSILKILSQVHGSIAEPEITGILDDATEDSLFSFQQLSGLPATGHLDKHTWKHLALQYPLAANLLEGDTAQG